MSLATIIGGLIAYPINRWLVAKGLKHGMMTVRKGEESHQHRMEKDEPSHKSDEHHEKKPFLKSRSKKD
ncbi:MAG: hypothetical protein HRU43_00585 [Simkaniaceae bacterium]|nr:hypothetical protein [Simkaniaceae bacterium]